MDSEEYKNLVENPGNLFVNIVLSARDFQALISILNMKQCFIIEKRIRENSVIL